MAQRAYRQRKETTLEEFRKRVSELQGTVELMNKAFKDFSNRRLASKDISRELINDLQETAAQYAELVKTARNPYEPTVVEEAKDDVTKRLSAVTFPVAPPIARAPSTDSSKALSAPRQDLVFPQDHVWGYSFLEDSQDESSMQLSTQPSNTPLEQPSRPLSRLATIASPFTYSFQETTFARRLHRACLEMGYQLVCDPSRRPQSYDRVFKLCLAIEGGSRDGLLARLRAQLMKGTKESLDWTGVPFLHLGGAAKAGDVVGEERWPTADGLERQGVGRDTGSAAGWRTGPLREWFDPQDVEGYLAEKGICIEAQSSFAEIELPITELPSNSSSESLSSGDEGNAGSQPSLPSLSMPQTPLLTMLDAPVLIDNNDKPAQQDVQDTDFLDAFLGTGVQNFENPDWFQFSDVGYSNTMTGSFMNFLPSGSNITQSSIRDLFSSSDLPKNEITASSTLDSQTDAVSSAPRLRRTNEFTTTVPSVEDCGWLSFLPAQYGTQQKAMVTIDVTKLIKVLAIAAVCLGATPGFRRKDVDKALQASIVSTFDNVIA
ncbi:hypothetical protein H2203_001914 [Taxawa tesnikishii (nom. ined.)]|nr:hypothetical protein H2203_001914 [Dothideales sp. JES 119]